MFEDNNKDIRTTPLAIVSFVNFEHVTANWVCVELSRSHSNCPFPILRKSLKNVVLKKIIIINKKRFNIDIEVTKISNTSSKLSHNKLPKNTETSKG